MEMSRSAVQPNGRCHLAQVARVRRSVADKRAGGIGLLHRQAEKERGERATLSDYIIKGFARTSLNASGESSRNWAGSSRYQSGRGGGGLSLGGRHLQTHLSLLADRDFIRHEMEGEGGTARQGQLTPELALFARVPTFCRGGLRPPTAFFQNRLPRLPDFRSKAKPCLL